MIIVQLAGFDGHVSAYDVRTHDSSGGSGDHTVQHERRDEAGLFGPRVGLHQLGIVAEEALHVHAEQVGALHVVRQQHGGGHDGELQEEHDGQWRAAVEKDRHHVSY